jgi:UDP-sulfoquinovose synthase
VALAVAHPADPGELRVYNQFTEQFSVLELAERVKAAAEHLGWTVDVAHTANPRVEAEDHYYNARHTKLVELGLQPRLLNEELIDTMLLTIKAHEERIDPSTLVQNVRWVPDRASEPSRA